MRSLFFFLAWIASILIILYFSIKPVPILPIEWQAPPNPGYTGDYARNDKLSKLELIDLQTFRGPEDITVDQAGNIFVSTDRGHILKLDKNGGDITVFAKTAGRPLGLAFDVAGNLIVADAYLGLLSISLIGKQTLLTNQVGGEDIGFANNLDIAKNGRIYFTDSTIKFPPHSFGGTYDAARYDLMEHGGHGRLLVYDPLTKTTSTLMEKLNFPNGVVVSHDQKSVLVAEMGNYRVLRYWLSGPRKGQQATMLGPLPGFPDNLSKGANGRYWLAIASPRVQVLDRLASWPRLRKFTQRLPEAMWPKEINYGHVIAFNDKGEIVANLQDPSGVYPINSSAVEIGGYLYLGNLQLMKLGRLKLGGLQLK